VKSNIDHRRLARLRRGQGEIANHVIDEFAAGRLSRRDFIRRASVVGISVPLVGSILEACSSSSSSSGSSSASAGASSTATGAPGAVIRVGITTPAAAINPVTVSDQGGEDMLAQTGEYLCLSDQTLTLKPVLATSWSSNSAADVWTFKIRQGVKFHNGAPLTADDVVYSFKLYTAPKAAALSALGGALTPAGVQKVDDFTVAFHLEGANGSFPYLVSSDNYSTIIIPNNYDPAKWQSSFVGTGPFVLGSYTPKVGASFTRNEQYWGQKALPSATQFTFYDTQAPSVLAMTGGNIDVLGQFSVLGGEALLGGSYNVIKLKSSAHRELSMRADQAPFTDPRVRQAIALTLNRPQIVSALFKGLSDLGNDSPFAPVYPFTNTSVPQRAQNISQAKSLLAAAGHPNGFTTTLTTENIQEIPAFAQVVAQSAAAIGVKINLNVEAQSKYYGNYLFGTSDWLDATMSLVDYGHRGVPNLFLTATMETTNAKTGTGAWNAAHFSNAQYDSLVKQYVAAPDMSSQRSIAGQIQQLLLNETPMIIAYFYEYLTATATGITGVYPTAVGHIFLQNAAKS